MIGRTNFELIRMQFMYQKSGQKQMLPVVSILIYAVGLRVDLGVE